jgi:hypothetical protein
MIRPKVLQPSGKWTLFEKGLKAKRPSVSKETWQQDAYQSQTSVKTEWLKYADFISEWGLGEVA